MYELEDYIKYPIECQVNNSIPKNVIYEAANLNSKDKNIFTKNVKKINWLYSLKKSNTNINPYKDTTKEYQEVEIIEIKMKKQEETDRIADILQRFIPYPTLLIFHFHEQLKLCVAHKREHKSDKSKITITDLRMTKWINLLETDQFDEKLFQKLKLENLNHTNFYKLYCDITDNIIIYNGSKEAEKPLQSTAEEIKEINNQIYEINKKIKTLQTELKKETQFNKQTELNIQLHKLKQEKQKIEEKLI
jgi:hypothetical protein